MLLGFLRLVVTMYHRNVSSRPVSFSNRVALRLETLEPRALPSTFYLSPSGNDHNNGLSAATAWQTIARVNEHTFHAGDSILFEGGSSFSGSLRFNSSSKGTAAAPITVSSFGTGAATINGGKGYGLYVTDTAGFGISNLNFVGGAGNRTFGIAFEDGLRGSAKLQHVYIDSVNVSGFGRDGIDVGALGSADGYDDVRITNVAAHGNGEEGISVWGQTRAASNKHVHIGHCTAYDNGAGGIEIGDTDVATIERSVAHDNGLGPDANVGIWAFDSNRITIQYDESYHNQTPNSLDGDGFDFDGGVTNSVMQYNYSHDNDGAGFMIGEYPGSAPTRGNVIRFNISQNDGRLNGYGGIFLYNLDRPTTKVTHNWIYNNTVYNSAGGADIVVAGNLTGSVNVFANNLLQTANGVPLIVWAGKSGATFVGNDYWSSGGPFVIRYDGTTYSSLAAFRGNGRETFGNQPTGYTIDPQLANPGGGTTINDSDLLDTLAAYQLQPASTLIGTGLDLHALYGINPVPEDGPLNIGTE